VMTPLYGKESRTKTKERKLPFALPHEEFRIGRTKLPEIRMTKREGKLQYLARLQEAVSQIQLLATSSKDMRSKLKDGGVQTALRDLGVLCFPQFLPEKTKSRRRGSTATTEEKPVSDERLPFRFVDSPHLFYPFDKQWKGAAETNDE